MAVKCAKRMNEELGGKKARMPRSENLQNGFARRGAERAATNEISFPDDDDPPSDSPICIKPAQRSGVRPWAQSLSL